MNPEILFRGKQEDRGDIMYVLERRTLQAGESCLRRQWARAAICSNRSLLDKVRAGQQRPGDWRVRFIPCPIQAVMKKAQRAA